MAVNETFLTNAEANHLIKVEIRGARVTATDGFLSNLIVNHQLDLGIPIRVLGAPGAAIVGKGQRKINGDGTVV
jgi:hypothetical protein